MQLNKLIQSWGIVETEKIQAKISKKDKIIRELKEYTTKLTTAGLQKTSLAKLQELKLGFTNDMDNDLPSTLTTTAKIQTWENDIMTSPISKYSKKDLEEIGYRLGLTGSSNSSVSNSVEKLLNLPQTAIPEPVKLDTDQIDAIEKVFHNEKNIIYGPPGAGKTLVLCQIALKEIEAHPDANVLFLSFNVNAEKTIRKRLKFLGIPKNKLPNRKELISKSNSEKFIIVAAESLSLPDTLISFNISAKTLKGQIINIKKKNKNFLNMTDLYTNFT